MGVNFDGSAGAPEALACLVGPGKALNPMLRNAVTSTITGCLSSVTLRSRIEERPFSFFIENKPSVNADCA